MALLKFLKGNYSTLNTAAINEGQVLVCGDTGELFVDVAANKRVKIGDFVVISTLSELEAIDVTSVPTSRLYYVEDGNILARSNGSAWIQINKQKTLAELGGVTQSVYNAKITALEKADTDNSTAIESLKGYVGTIPDSATATDIVGYVQEKTADIATSANLEEISARVTGAEGDIDALETAVGNIKDGTDIDSFADVETKLAEKVDKVEGKSLVSDTEITKLTGVSEGANKVEASTTNGKIKIDGVETVVYTHPANHTISEITGLQDAIDAAKKAGDDAQADVDALEAKVGAVTEGKTVVQMITEAQTAATYDDTAVKDRISAIENDYLKGADKTALETAIAAAKKAGDDAQADIDAFLAAAEVGDAAIDALKEIQDYIESDGTAATEMTNKISALETAVGDAESGLVKDVADNATAITTEKNRAEGAENALDARLDVLEAIDHSVYAKAADVTASQSAQDTKIDANAEAIATLNGTGEGSVSKKISDAITDANLGQYAKQADLEAHTGDTDIHITAAERIAWNAAQANAEATAAAALASARTEITAEIDADVAALASGQVKTNTDAIAANAKAITDGDAAVEAKVTALADKTYTKTEVDALIAQAQQWGEF